MICGDGAAISSSVGDGSNYNEGRKPFLFPAEKKKKDEEEGGEGGGDKCVINTKIYNTIIIVLHT